MDGLEHDMMTEGAWPALRSGPALGAIAEQYPYRLADIVVPALSDV